MQLPVAWDAKATCPTFDEWLSRRFPFAAAVMACWKTCPDVDDRLTAAESRLPGRWDTHGQVHVHAARGQIAGPGNSSAEELADLSTNKFRAAQLFGKMLNVASDIKSPHLADVSVFKKATGDDALLG